MKIDGGCHCGNITYTAEIDPQNVAICHCADCQTLSASAFRTIVMVPEENLELKGEPKVYVKTSESGNQREQTFCPECGSGLYATSVGDGPKVYNFRAGTVRQRDQLVPKVQYWTRSSLPWLGEMASIPGFEKQKPG